MMTKGEQMAASYAGCRAELRAEMMRCEIAHGIENAFGACRVLSIDAWHDGDGWTWNSWHTVAHFPRALLDLKPRAILRELRARTNLTGYGRVAIDDDGYNVIVIDKNTREPLFAIEYGSKF